MIIRLANMRRGIILAFITVLFSTNTFALNPSIPDFADIAEPLLPAVVNISTVHYPKKAEKRQPKKGYQEENPLDFFNEFLEKFGIPPHNFEEPFLNQELISLGSGFIIDPKGYIVTNYHVIKDADKINVKLHNNTELMAKIVGIDPRTDIALLKVEYTEDLPFVKFGNSSTVRTGNWVIAIGNPYRLGGTLTVGVVSATAREVDILSNGIIDEYIQTDAAINPGNSGGPLFNIAGEVIGVNRAIQSSSPHGGNIGIGFAIPSSIAQKVVKELKEHGKVSRGMLSIKILSVSDEIAESLGMKTPHGALVAEVIKGGSGDKAGIQVGDVIVEYNGKEIKTANTLSRLVSETPIGNNVKLKILRNGKYIELQTIIREGEIKDLTNPKGMQQDEQLPYEGTVKKHGVLLGNITPEIRQRYSLSPNVSGIIILKIDYSSNWIKKGLQKEDIIVSINQQPIKNVTDFEMLYNQAKKDKKKHILLSLKRYNNNLFIAVPIDDEN